MKSMSCLGLLQDCSWELNACVWAGACVYRKISLIRCLPLPHLEVNPTPFPVPGTLASVRKLTHSH